jgi:hypothetical protein
MALHALEDLDDALDVARAFLTPIDRTAWVKLAVVVFFIGGPGANLNSFQYTFGGDGGGGAPPGGVIGPEFGPRTWLLIATIIGVVLLVALGFALVGSVMEFVFVESLRTGEVKMRQYWNQRWRQGLRLFGFRVVVGLFVFGSVLLLSLPFLLPLLNADPVSGEVLVGFVLVLLPLFVVIAVVTGLVNGFTTVFVVPIMVLDDCGVLAGWRRLWPTITSQWEQYLAYVVTSFFLTMLGGILVVVVAAVLAVVLLIPFGLLFGIGFVLLTVVSQPLGIVVLVLVGILFVLAIFAVIALVEVPVQTYLRYYALLVLGDVEAEFDLIPDQRAAVRNSRSTQAS